MNKKTLAASVAAAMSALVLTGCSVATPNTSNFGLHYTGGPFSSQNFEYCVAPGARNMGGPGDYDYFLPAGTRTVSFGRPGSEAPATNIKTRSNIELVGGGIVSFHINYAEAGKMCEPWTDPQGKAWPGGKAQKLFDSHLRQRQAFASDGDDPMPASWVGFLQEMVVGSVDRAMDTSGQVYDYQTLYNDPVERAKWIEAVKVEAPKNLDRLLGGPLIVIDAVELDSPAVTGDIYAGFQAFEKARLTANAAEEDKRAAATFPGGIAAYQEYQQKKSVNKAIEDGKVQVLPVPYGSNIIVQGR